MTNIISKVLIVYMYLMYLVFGLVGLGIHLWTIETVYYNWGIIWAIISFFFPLISQVAVTLIIWFGSGLFINVYSEVLIIYLICYFVFIVLAGILIDKYSNT